MIFFSQLVSGAAGDAPQNDFLEHLIAMMAAGDIKALEMLYAQTKTAVYGFSLSILKSPQSAEDVMQDTYIKMYAAAAQYQARGKPMAWILTIVRNLSLMKLRSGKQQALPLEDIAQLSTGHDDTESVTDRMLLHTALETLADAERQIVMLHSVSGLKHREIADMLDIPLPTVLSKYRRALAKLQKLLKEEAQ